MADFAIAYAPLKEFEGGWCKVQADRGGETYAGCARVFFPSCSIWGIIDAEKRHPSYKEGARAFSRHLSTLPELTEQVTEWYRTEWWEKLGLGTLPQNLANEIFEQSVNLGRGGCGRYVQRMCNAFNYNPKTGSAFFAPLKEDGILGRASLIALGCILRERAKDGCALVHVLNCLQCAHYIGLAAKNSQQRQFLTGWLTRTYTHKEA